MSEGEQLTAERIEFYESLKIDAGMAVADWWYNEFDDSTALDALNLDEIHNAWLKLLGIEASGHFYCCGNPDPVVKMCDDNLTAGNGMEDYDACVTSAVIQIALLKEIKY